MNLHLNDSEFTLKWLWIYIETIINSIEIIMDLHLNDSNNNNIMLEH